tara:strand:- start:1019 stop:1303 length:285 start_codon:yes stop_codon:yes gene_type:complete
MFEALLENSLLVVMTLVITTAFGGLTAYFRQRTSCLKKIADEVGDLQKRSYRIEKAMIILAKLQEDVVERIHPELKTEWEEIVKELLSGNGNGR